MSSFSDLLTHATEAARCKAPIVSLHALWGRLNLNMAEVLTGLSPLNVFAETCIRAEADLLPGSIAFDEVVIDAWHSQPKTPKNIEDALGRIGQSIRRIESFTSDTGLIVPMIRRVLVDICVVALMAVADSPSANETPEVRAEA